MDVGYPVVFIRDGQRYAALGVRRVLETELAKGVDLALDLTYFDPTTRQMCYEEAVPYLNTDQLVPPSGGWFVEVGASSIEERRENKERRDRAVEIQKRNQEAYKQGGMAAEAQLAGEGAKRSLDPYDGNDDGAGAGDLDGKENERTEAEDARAPDTSDDDRPIG